MAECCIVRVHAWTIFSLAFDSRRYMCPLEQCQLCICPCMPRPCVCACMRLCMCLHALLCVVQGHARQHCFGNTSLRLQSEMKLILTIVLLINCINLCVHPCMCVHVYMHLCIYLHIYLYTSNAECSAEPCRGSCYRLYMAVYIGKVIPRALYKVQHCI